MNKSSQNSPELTEFKKQKFSYPFGLGAFLMNGCYLFTGLPSQPSHQSFDNLNFNNANNNNNANLNNDYNDYGNTNMNYDDTLMFKKRKRRNLETTKTNVSTRTDDLRNFCSRYAKLEKTVECNVNALSHCFPSLSNEMIHNICLNLENHTGSLCARHRIRCQIRK